MDKSKEELFSSLEGWQDCLGLFETQPGICSLHGVRQRKDWFMSEKRTGGFSSEYLSLQLQLKTLLEGYGGDHALCFMDALGALAQSEQTVALEVFTKIINRVAEGQERFLSEGDLARKDFEDKLYADILSAMRDAAQEASGSRLKVVNGGRTPIQASTVEKRPLSLCDARKQRKNSTKPLIN